MEKITKFAKSLLEKEVAPLAWLAIFFACIFFRFFVEQILALARPLTDVGAVMEITHNFYFFSLTILLLWMFLSFILKAKPHKLSFVMLFSVVFVVIPPLIDMIRTGGQVYWSFYILSSPADLLKQYLSVFGHLPSGIVYFGTRIVSVIAVFFVAGLAWVLTKKKGKTFLAALGTYSIFFFMGAFPSFFYYFYVFFSRSGRVAAVHSFDIAGFLGAPEKIFGVVFPSFQYTLAYKVSYIYFIILVALLAVFYYWENREKFWAVIKNARFPQIIYHAGIFFIGIGLGVLNYRQNFRLDFFSFLAATVLLLCVILSWLASVAINDIYDFPVDTVSNRERPLPKNILTHKEYLQFGLICFFLALLGGITISLPFIAFFAVYQFLAWLYSAPPFRLKRFPIVATFMSASASIIILFIGYALMSDGQTIHTLSIRIVFLLLIAYTLSLPVKDFKDIEGDKKDGIWTIPVLFGEKNGRLIVATGVFISYVLSVFFLNETKLFFWAMFFGAASFLIINNEKIKARKLPTWVLGTATVYFFILVWVAFL